MKLVKYALKLLLNLDLAVLRAAKACVGFLEDWFSLPQSRVERVLLAAMVSSYAYCVWSTWWVLTIPFMVGLAWSRHRKPAAMRAARIASAAEIFGRLYCVCWASVGLTCLAFAIASGFRGWHVPALILWASWFSFEYITALPYESGGLGRRRKLALAKLKEMFGVSWMPLPEGGPA